MTRGPWRAALVVAALAAAGALTLVTRPARIGNADLADYACARSLWFDHDLQVQNDDRLLGVDAAALTAAGHDPHACAIGKAVLWSPAIGAAHLAAHLARLAGVTVAADGTSAPYRQAVRLAGLLYGLAGLWCCYVIARTRFGARVSIVSVVAVAAGSFVLWSLLAEPASAVSLSLALSAAVCAVWVVRVDDLHTPQSWLVLGLFAGLLVLLRWQHLFVLALPAVALMRHWYRAHEPAGRRAVLVCAALFVTGAAVGLLPQVVAAEAGGPGPSALGRAVLAAVTSGPRVVDRLWSTRNGLLAASPVLYASAMGLVLLWRYERRLATAGVFLFVATLWTDAPGTGGRDGAQAFAAVVPFFVCGAAAFALALTRALARRPAMAAGALAATLVLWNFTLMGAARTGVFGIGEPVSFGTLAAAQAGLLHDWIGHPPAYPANVAYALENGVGPGAFDVLYGNRFLRDPSRPRGPIDIGGPADGPYVVSGWHLPEHDGRRTFRWARATAQLIVPLDHAANLTLHLTLQPFDAPGAPPQRLTVVVNGTTLPALDLAPGWQSVDVLAPAVAWRAGVNRVSLEFAHETRPADLGAADTRPLAAAVDTVDLRESD
jgi:hypothetical protein